MDKKITGIVIKNYDVGDRDKLITIFCPEGLIYAKLKGVNSPKSKLKFAKQCFCFAEFVITGKKNNVITSVNLIDSFYDLTKDYDVFEEATKILSLAKPLMKQDQSNPYLFLTLIKCFKTLAYSNVQHRVTEIKFLLDLFYNQGYGFESEQCVNCGSVLNHERFLNFSTGEVLCNFCKDQYCEKISYGTNKVLKIVKDTDYERLQNIKFGKTIVLDALSMLLKNYATVIV